MEGVATLPISLLLFTPEPTPDHCRKHKGHSPHAAAAVAGYMRKQQICMSPNSTLKSRGIKRHREGQRQGVGASGAPLMRPATVRHTAMQPNLLSGALHKGHRTSSTADEAYRKLSQKKDSALECACPGPHILLSTTSSPIPSLQSPECAPLPCSLDIQGTGLG